MYNCIFYCYKSKKTKEFHVEDIYPLSKKKNNQFINNIELPKEWIEKISISGETYWYNIKTHERSYISPKREIIDIPNKKSV